MDRDALEPLIAAACRAAGLEPARVEWIRAELSLRHFARVHTTSTDWPTLVARVEAPEDPAGRPAGAAPEPPHEPIRALLERHGLPVPRRLGGDARHGIELLEDVGPHSLRDAAPTLAPGARHALYADACALVPRLQRIAREPGVAAFDRSLDAALIAYKADLVVRWGLAARGRDASATEAAIVRDAFARIADEAARAPQRLAHRDFQGANLFVAADARGVSRLRMIDLQGAFLAPPEYDLVSLLCDSYVELADDEIAAQAEAVRAALPDALDRESFARRFDLLTLARKGKDHALFHFVARTRGDERYLRFVPATVRHLRGAAQRAARRDARLAPLADLVAELPETPCAR